MSEKDRKRTILERLQAELTAEEVPAILRKKEEEDLPMDVLTVLLTEYGSRQDEVSGEFYFLPLANGAEHVCYFSSYTCLIFDSHASLSALSFSVTYELHESYILYFIF